MHSCIFLSTFDASLGHSAFLSFACQHGPSQGRSVRRLLLPFFSFQEWNGRLLSITVFFYKVYLNTLDICLFCLLGRVLSGQSIESSAPLLRVLSIFLSDILLRRLQSCWRLFLIMLPTFSKRGLQRCQQPC